LTALKSYLKEGFKKKGNKKEFLSIEFWQYRHRGTFIGTGIGTADLKKKYRTTGTAVDFESTASKPVRRPIGNNKIRQAEGRSRQG